MFSCTEFNTMNIRIVFTVLLFSAITYSRAQQRPEQDCFSALPVCQDTFLQVNSYFGEGENPDEINPALMSCEPRIGERNSVWYTFRIETGGQLCFTLSPLEPTDDYDWSLYNITNSSCAAIATQPGLEVSCSRDAPNLDDGCNGETGPDGEISGPCSGDNRACIPVNTGDEFVLNISNFTGFDNGYVLDFNESTAVLFDDTPPSLVAAEPDCEGVIVTFSENVLCGTVEPGDFTITGPGGPYDITEVISESCESGGNYDQQYFLRMDPLVQEEGNFNVSLIGQVSDFCNNPALQTTQIVRLTPIPQAEFAVEEAQCFEDNEFDFEYTGSPNATSFQWNLGDGTIATTRTVSHSYQIPGIKSFELVVRDANGCTDTSRQTVTVYPHPNADFALPNSLCVGDSIQINNLSTIDSLSTLIGYEWTFGDGGSSNDSTPVHIYQQTGEYVITLTAFGTNNCPDETEQRYTVFPIPEVDFVVDGQTCAREPVSFRNESVIRSDVAGATIPVQNLIWDFGNSTADGIETPTATFDSAGLYPVTLAATSSQGCTDSATLPVEIFETAIPEIQEDSTCIGSSLILEAIPPAGSLTYWYTSQNDSIADFIDEILTLNNLLGDTILYVEAISSQGCVSERIPIMGSVIEPGDASLFSSDTLVDIPFSGVFFSISGDVDPLSYEWDFGDGETSTEANPLHIFNNPGEYLVSVSFEDVSGCEYELLQNILVNKETNFFIPTAFSPNGDGFNDTYTIQQRLLNRFLFQIFDRFGNMIFESFDPTFIWDGTYNGTTVPEGVYLYRLRAIDVTGIYFEDEGTITVIK